MLFHILKSISDSNSIDYQSLFKHNFIQNPLPTSDDILFFYTVLNEIKVLRLSANLTLPSEIHWKETLYLNAITQTKSTLAVSVCYRLNGVMKSRRRVAVDVYASPYKTRMDVKNSTNTGTIAF